MNSPRTWLSLWYTYLCQVVSVMLRLVGGMQEAHPPLRNGFLTCLTAGQGQYGCDWSSSISRANRFLDWFKGDTILSLT